MHNYNFLMQNLRQKNYAHKNAKFTFIACKIDDLLQQKIIIPALNS